MSSRYFSNAPWQAANGYCRAIRRGPHIFVAGTTAVSKDGTLPAGVPAAEQAGRCFDIIREALAHFGAEFSCVVRTRIYLTDSGDCEAVGQLHAEVFQDFPPASTMLVVARLIEPELKVEIEVDAYVGD